MTIKIGPHVLKFLGFEVDRHGRLMAITQAKTGQVIIFPYSVHPAEITE